MAHLDLQEDIGIKNIKEFYRGLVDMLRTESEITLDFSNVQHIDLSLAQVLLAARKFARKENKVIKLKSISPELRQQLVITGLAK